jgi:hypothetical protein
MSFIGIYQSIKVSIYFKAISIEEIDQAWAWQEN